MSKAVLTLETLTCPTCIVKIEEALIKEEGIEELRVLFHASKICATFNHQLISAVEIIETIKSLGFEVRSYKIAI